MDWLARLETGQMSEVARAVIKIPLDGTPADVERRVRRYGDFSKMNNRWYASDSVKTHDRLANNPEEWRTTTRSIASFARPGRSCR